MAARSKRTTGKAVAARKKSASAAKRTRDWGRNDTGLDRKAPSKGKTATAKKALSKARKTPGGKKK